MMLFRPTGRPTLIAGYIMWVSVWLEPESLCEPGERVSYYFLLILFYTQRYVYVQREIIIILPL